MDNEFKGWESRNITLVVGLIHALIPLVQCSASICFSKDCSRNTSSKYLLVIVVPSFSEAEFFSFVRFELSLIVLVVFCNDSFSLFSEFLIFFDIVSGRRWFAKWFNIEDLPAPCIPITPTTRKSGFSVRTLLNPDNVNCCKSSTNRTDWNIYEFQ